MTETGTDIAFHEKAVLAIIVAAILIVGIYPQPFLDMMSGISDSILKSADVGHLLKK